MFAEEELIPISALQHLMFCERQLALIHLDGAWEENRFTAGGRVLHERAHGNEAEARRDVRITRGLSLRSLHWGLIGKADVVEFHRLPDTEAASGATLPGRKGRWRPYPVEYKAGRPKVERCDAVQLCAQALCLEEMLGTGVPRGALFYGKPQRRTEVAFDEGLRNETAATLARLRRIQDGSVKAQGRYDRKCEACSLREICLPRLTRQAPSARRYVESLFEPVSEKLP